MIETSFQRYSDRREVLFQLKETIFDRPEVVSFSLTVRDNFVPKLLGLICGPLTREIEKFGQTGSSLFLSDGS